MKHLKMLGLAAVAAMALTAFTAGSAAATTLEVNGVTQNKAVTTEWSLLTSTRVYTARTDGSLANECTISNVKGTTASPFTGATVTGPVSTLTFEGCTRPVTVHKAGTLHVAHVAGTTNGTVTSSGAEITVGSPFGTLNCKTGAGTHFGTLIGKAAGRATLENHSVLNCGFLVPSVTWKATYEATSPSGTGVSA